MQKQNRGFLIKSYIIKFSQKDVDLSADEKLVLEWFIKNIINIYSMLKSKIEKFLNVVTGYLNELEFKVPDVDRNIGRILSIFGIDLNQRKSNETGSLWSIRAYVAELEDPGTSPKNPYLPAEFDKTDAVAVRKEIYKYYLKRLNLSGHRAGEVL